MLDGVDPSVMVGAAMRFVTGEAAGRRLFCTGTVGDVLLGGAGTGQRFEGVRPGDEVTVDNREYLAFTYFHRHQVDRACARVRAVLRRRASDLPAARAQLRAQRAAVGRDAARRVHRQDDRRAERARRRVLAERRARRTGGSSSAHLGDAARRPLPPVVQRPCRPPPGIDQSGRCAARPDHAPRSTTAARSSRHSATSWPGSRTVSRRPPSRATRSTPTSGSRLAPAAAERGGVQPVVHGDGERRAHVPTWPWGGRRARGRRSTRRPAAARSSPPNGTSTAPARSRTATTRSTAHVRRCGVETTHAFDQPGTYFPCVRVTAHRDGDVDAAALPLAQPRPGARRRHLTVGRPRLRPDFLGNTAITGVGYTELTKASGRSVLDLATEACAAAIADAGLTPRRRRRRRQLPVPRGLGAHAGGRDGARHARAATGCSTSTSAARRRATSSPRPRWRCTSGWPATVVVFRALNGRSGARVGTNRAPGPGHRLPVPGGAHRVRALHLAVGAPLPDRHRAVRGRPRRRSRSRSAQWAEQQRTRLPPRAALVRSAPRARRTSPSRSVCPTARSRSTARARS